jgi:hypothetical protein
MVGEDFVAKSTVGDQVSFRSGNALEAEFPAEQCAVLMSYLSSSIPGDTLLPTYTKAFEATKPGPALVFGFWGVGFGLEDAFGPHFMFGLKVPLVFALSFMFPFGFYYTIAGGFIFIHDFVIENDRKGPPLTALWALQHMVFTPGAESLTPKMISDRLSAAGYVDIQWFEMIPGMTKLAVGVKPV